MLNEYTKKQVNQVVVSNTTKFLNHENACPGQCIGLTFSLYRLTHPMSTAIQQSWELRRKWEYLIWSVFSSLAPSGFWEADFITKGQQPSGHCPDPSIDTCWCIVSLFYYLQKSMQRRRVKKDFENFSLEIILKISFSDWRENFFFLSELAIWLTSY